MKIRRNLGKVMALMAVLSMILSISGYGQEPGTKTAVNGGNWSVGSTWGNGANAIVPATGDNIIIPDGKTVTLDVNTTISNLTLGTNKNNTDDAKLQFSNVSHYTLTITGNLNVGLSASEKPTGSIDMSNSGTINIGGTVNINKPGIWTPGAGTVNFNGTATQTLPSTWMTSYKNLTISGGGTKNIPTGVTVSGILSMEGTATVSQAPTYGTTATLQYNTSTDRTNGAEWISDFTASGGVLIKNTGIITLDKARAYTLSKLTIDPGFLIIPAGGQVSVTGDTKITSSNGLTIESVSEENNGAGTGSFKTATTTGSGTASVIRYMSPNRWHIVSSPVSGQSIIAFLGANGNIPKNTAPGAPTTEPYERGMRGYDPLNNQWGNFFKNNTTTGNIEKGKGFLMRVKGTTGTKNVTFTGALNAGDVTVTLLEAEAGKWNCIGNPYTSAIGINSESGSTNFLSVNGGNLDPSFGAIYIWHQTDAEVTSTTGVYNETSGTYQTISNTPFVSPDYLESTENAIQQGQAFMVKMRPLTTGETSIGISFNKNMQLHNTGLALKSTDGIWPTIKLTATADSITSSTIIAFHEGMTPGLDPTYDAGLLKGGASVEVYTRLVEDNGIPFDIQALPANYESTVVPVGLDCTKGGQVSFSAELMHVPSSCQVLLEDRLNKVLTDLSVNSYTADLMGTTVSQDRFFLHTSYSTTGMDSPDRIQNLKAWAGSNRELKISGKVSSKAIATLYDLQGRAVNVSPLQAGDLNSVPLKGLKQGVYLLRVQDNSRTQVLKVTLSK